VHANLSVLGKVVHDVADSRFGKIIILGMAFRLICICIVSVIEVYDQQEEKRHEEKNKP